MTIKQFAQAAINSYNKILERLPNASFTDMLKITYNELEYDLGFGTISSIDPLDIDNKEAFASRVLDNLLSGHWIRTEDDDAKQNFIKRTFNSEVI